MSFHDTATIAPIAMIPEILSTDDTVDCPTAALNAMTTGIDCARAVFAIAYGAFRTDGHTSIGDHTTLRASEYTDVLLATHIALSLPRKGLPRDIKTLTLPAIYDSHSGLRFTGARNYEGELSAFDGFWGDTFNVIVDLTPDFDIDDDFLPTVADPLVHYIGTAARAHSSFARHIVVIVREPSSKTG